MPPPPPPSASYNLVIVDSSDEDNDDMYSSDDVYGSNSLPWAKATPVALNAADFHSDKGDIVEATNVNVVGSTEEEDSDSPSDDDDDEDVASALEVNACVSDGNDVVTAVKVKKKKKNKKKSKKKKKKSKTEQPTTAAVIECAQSLSVASSRKVEEIQSEGTKSSKPKKSVTFGTVSVREYARTLGTHTVPADGGWPLGLSSHLAVEHTHQQWLDHQKTLTVNDSRPSSPSKQPRNGHHSPTLTHGHRHDHPRGWTVSSFEARKQTELQHRYIQLIRDQRRRKYEKEWEKNHLNKFLSGHSYNTRKGKKRSDSVSGVRTSSGKLKMEMSLEEREEMDRLIAEPVVLPRVDYFETRQYDYKKRIKAVKNVDPGMTEEEELLMNHRGRNPLFVVLKEEERRKVLLRDDQWFKQCHVIPEKDDDRCRPSNGKQFQTEEGQEDQQSLDLTDPTVTQHIQHDLEALRIQRSDPTNLGCSCRKLHVFLPGSTDKSHHKKKGSHRRLPERKVREELRRRGISADGMSRDKMEKALHDAINKEPCCSNNDCPCVRSGIGCQADTCSCWHPSHDGASTAAGSASKKENSEARNVVDQDVHEIEQRCGNVNGMYVVNFGKIRRCRERYLQ